MRLRRVPIYFDPRIDLIEVVRLISNAGYTLKANRRAELIVTRGTDPVPASNVIPFRRPPCA